MRKENVLKCVLENDIDLFWEDLRPSQAGQKRMARGSRLNRRAAFSRLPVKTRRGSIRGRIPLIQREGCPGSLEVVRLPFALARLIA